MTSTRRRRHPTPRHELRCRCGQDLKRFWSFCPWCGREKTWRDDPPLTGAECGYCGWVVSDLFSFCPWCGSDIYEEGYSSEDPLLAPKGFRKTAMCDWGCGGGVQYPMPHCPWCGRDQEWHDNHVGTCPHCSRGVEDWWHVCPWCGFDPSGQDLIAGPLVRVRQLLTAARIKDWGYRVLLRPGVSGVDPKHGALIEIDSTYVVNAQRRREIPWTMLVGLICHELGHSFLYYHWSWVRTREFARIFGEAGKAYRVRDDTWVNFKKKKVTRVRPGFVSTYAATHPLEDFAEVFRIYVTRKGKMRELLADLGQARKDGVLYEKFLLLHRFVRSLRGWQ